MHGKTMRLLELYLIFVLYMLTLFCLWKRRENCYYRTRNNGLRYYRTSIVDFAKTTFETLALCFTRHLVLLITFLISNTCILPWDDRIALQSYSRKSGQAGAWAAWLLPPLPSLGRVAGCCPHRLAWLAGRLAAAAWAGWLARLPPPPRYVTYYLNSQKYSKNIQKIRVKF